MAKSLYKRASENGFVMGILLSVISLMAMMSMKYVFLSLPATILILSVPVLVYYFLRKQYVREYGAATFYSLWFMGILIFGYASLICALVTFIFMTYIEPTYIYDNMKMALDILTANPVKGNEDMVALLQDAVTKKYIPTPIQVAIEMIWFTVFSGSLLSILVSGVARIKKVNLNKI